jgi:AraC-like DNA-binding protein/GNAT superfamily N-acetyltransferase
MTIRQSSKPLNRALHYLETHLKEPASVEATAALVGYSRAHFSRLFLAVTGITPVAYLRKRRLTEAARELATSSKRILDIALDYQFQSQEAFTRSFKQEFGVSPGYYRMRKRLRRLFQRISLGASPLLYPGRGLDTTPRLFVPEPQIVTALIVPSVRNRQVELRVQGVTPMRMDTPKIRLAHRQDMAALCRLYHELHEFTVRGVPDRLQSLGAFDYFDATGLSLTVEKLIDAVDVALWVAEVNGQVVGLAEVYLREDEANDLRTVYRYGYLQCLVVDRRLRGHGIGRQLLAAAEQWSREQGATELRLETWEFDQGPLGFYTRQGYRTLRQTLVRSLLERH